MPTFNKDDIQKLKDRKGRKESRIPSVDLERTIQQEERAEISDREKRLGPPAITESRCHVCQSPYRQFIEAMLIKGHTYVSISERVPGADGKKLDRRSISRHAKEHLAFEEIALRELIEDEATLEGKNFEEGKRKILTNRAVLEAALERAYNDIISGITTVEPRDLVQIVKLRNEMETAYAEAQIEELRAQVAIFMQAIQDTCDIDLQNEIVKRVQVIRKRENITGAVENALPQGEIQEVEVVEE